MRGRNDRISNCYEKSIGENNKLGGHELGSMLIRIDAIGSQWQIWVGHATPGAVGAKLDASFCSHKQ